MNRLHEDGQSRATDRLREQTVAVGHDLRELGSLTQEAAKEKVTQVRDMASEYVDQGKKTIGDIGKQMGKYVQQRPVKALGLAAGTGILLGYALSLYRRR